MLSSLQEELVSAAVFRYITDAITKEEALEMLKSRAATKAEREQRVRETGYPAYVTSAGWLGYDDEKVRRLTKEALDAGFNHFKVSCLTYLL
jgi:L-fuconate dehydratase